MIKIVYILMISFLIVFNTNAQKIKSITELAFGEPEVIAISERKAKKELRKLKTYPEHFNLYFKFKSISNFDKNGNLILQTYSKENGDIYMIVEYEYTDSGNIRLKSYRNLSNPESNSQVSYKYNSKNELVLVTDSSRKFIKQILISYPDANSKESVVKINGEYVERTINQLDTLKNSAIITTFVDNDSISSIKQKWYNRNNKIVKELVCNSNQKILVEKVVEFDNVNNRVFSKSWLHRRSKTANRYRSVDYFLGAKKNVVFPTVKKEDYFNKGEIIFNTEHYLSSTREPFCFTKLSDYNFDMNNNWTERIDYWNGKIQSVTCRHIEYYD